MKHPERIGEEVNDGDYLLPFDTAQCYFYIILRTFVMEAAQSGLSTTKGNMLVNVPFQHKFKKLSSDNQWR